MTSQRLLTTATVSDRLSVPVGTLRYWRKVGLGPAWFKLEGSIRYGERDLLEYIADNRHTPSVRAFLQEERA